MYMYLQYLIISLFQIQHLVLMWLIVLKIMRQEITTAPFYEHLDDKCLHIFVCFVRVFAVAFLLLSISGSLHLQSGVNFCGILFLAGIFCCGTLWIMIKTTNIQCHMESFHLFMSGHILTTNPYRMFYHQTLKIQQQH